MLGNDCMARGSNFLNGIWNICNNGGMGARKVRIDKLGNNYRNLD